MPLPWFWRRCLSRHFRKPEGLLGQWAARYMEKNNPNHYSKTIALLDLHAGDQVLEVGFGSGLAIRQILQTHPDVQVCGVDFSKLMIRRAKENNQAWIRTKQVELFLGDFLTHDFGARRFTRIFGINVVYFWEDLGRAFNRLYHLLEPEGRLVLFMSSPERLNSVPFAVDEVFHKRPLEHVANRLHEAGFRPVTHETVAKNGLETYYLCAEKPAPAKS